jgi:hypothetical protein
MIAVPKNDRVIEDEGYIFDDLLRYFIIIDSIALLGD